MKELRIKDICTKGSSTLKQKDVEKLSGKYPVYGASGLIAKMDSYHQEKDYIAIVKDGSGIGRVMFLPAKSSVIGTMQYILPKEGYDIFYIGYCLQSLNLSSYKQGAAIPHIYFRDYGERIVKVTDSISEQKDIVNRINVQFSKIDKLKQNAEAALDEAKALYIAELNDIMRAINSYTTRKVGDIFKTYSGGTPLKAHTEYYLNGNIPWLQSGEVNKKYITGTEKYITEEGLKNSSAKYYPVNTILVAMYGATAGQVSILKTEATSNQAICGILPNSQFLPEFVYYWFLYIQKKLVSLARGGAQPNISQIKIKSMPIPIVPLSIQCSIIEYLNSIETKIQKIEENYKDMTYNMLLLKQSILREIFD